jgi:hypothetical protein
MMMTMTATVVGITSNPSGDDSAAGDADAGGDPAGDDNLGDDKKTYFAVRD